MDVSSASSASASGLQTQVGNFVQRRAEEIQERNAQQLINSLPKAQPTPDPNATVGSRIDVFA
ncbi:putative motility protein [Nitrogeniibacter mangrovi]|uniref:Putative motility protein n=1 Tax=Nitrogeniibacter mangrovi TaxID=2016596 RepID=A0A6C1B7E7_9RHOO|nr:putative motility protein [Nitrogeniibacter mangrovi]QID18230.1 putative motility protein [Nitrogeniibacter mangrovi]